MVHHANLHSRLLDSLYCEGLVLSDEVRAAFDPSLRPALDPDNPASIALSCEALRTTARTMHAIAWLLNQRAYHRGELTQEQLDRHGRIATNLPRPEPANLRLIDPELADLALATQRFYARLVRIDASWRSPAPTPPPAVHAWHERLDRALSA